MLRRCINVDVVNTHRDGRDNFQLLSVCKQLAVNGTGQRRQDSVGVSGPIDECRARDAFFSFPALKHRVL